ncbi:MAG TPA: GDP-mannose 4,6-dehydratase [Acidimicrobiales bacterium]|nr:GDP-mannose 4,6-dehydratase [Acidimicrobiales bacterium]
MPPSPLRGRRVLVTGGAGFIGSHLVRRLLRDGAEVWVMTSSVSSVPPVRLTDVLDDVRIVEANLTDRSALDHTARTVRPEFIAHLGAYTHVGKSFVRVDENVASNVAGTVNLLQALHGDYERFVNTGTSEIYGDVDVPFVEDGPVNPVSPYSVSKYAAERFARMLHAAHEWPIVCLRPFNAYGPWQTADRVIPEIIVRGLKRRPLEMTEGVQTREFNFAADLADGFAAALVCKEAEGQVINLGCGQEVSMREIAVRILALMGDPIEAKFGALANRPTEIWRMYCDNSRAREILGWSPAHTLDEGLRETIDWYSARFTEGHPFLAGTALR